MSNIISKRNKKERLSFFVNSELAEKSKSNVEAKQINYQ